jgi:hypothetical protein
LKKTENLRSKLAVFSGKCAKSVQNFCAALRKMRKICAKILRCFARKHKILLVLRVFCAILNCSALFCFAQNAQKQRKTAHFARIRKEMHIPGGKLIRIRFLDFFEINKECKFYF